MPTRLRDLARPCRHCRGPLRDWEWACLGVVLFVLFVFALIQAV